MFQTVKRSAPWWFFLRLFLGIYLAITFFQAQNLSSFYDSESGLLPSSLSFSLFGQKPEFPNLFTILTGPALKGALMTASILSLGVVSNLATGLFALLGWLFWASLIERFAIISIPHDAFVGWLLIAIAIICFLNRNFLGKRQEGPVEIPRILFHLAWFAIGFTFLISLGLKLSSPSWQNGEAFELILRSPVTRGWTSILSQHQEIFPTLTYGALLIELLIGVLAILPFTRKYCWHLLLLFHLINFCFLHISHVSSGFLLFQIFLIPEEIAIFLRKRIMILTDFWKTKAETIEKR